jgi:adenine deaminase
LCTEYGSATDIAESGALERCVRREVKESNEACEKYQGVGERRMVTVSWRRDYGLRGKIPEGMYHKNLNLVVAFGFWTAMGAKMSFVKMP